MVGEVGFRQQHGVVVSLALVPARNHLNAMD
jgi:hypothetical protein